MPATTKENSNSEAARQVLESRCNEVTGGCEPVLSKVLSYFPDHAQRFFEEQQYALRIVGPEAAKDIRLLVKHREKELGTDGKAYVRGEIEYLDNEDPRIGPLLDQIKEIKKLRGEGAYRNPDGKLVYQGDFYIISQILSTCGMFEGKRNEQQRMTMMLLEVMQVTPEEHVILEEYVDIKRQEQMARELTGRIENGVRKLQLEIGTRFPNEA